MMPKPVKLVATVFLIVGLGLLVGGAYALSSTHEFIQKSETANGTVVDLERSRSRRSTTYHPVVRFTARDGKEYEVRSSAGSNPPGYRIGEGVRVFYDPDDPDHARIDSFFSLWGIPTMLGGMGLVFALAGGGMIYLPRRAAERRRFLLLHGSPVQTQFQTVERNTSIKVNGRSPWRIVSQWQNPATGRIHLFHSENLWFDPSSYVQAKEITVYLDRQNAKRYAMDTRFLPKMAE